MKHQGQNQIYVTKSLGVGCVCVRFNVISQITNTTQKSAGKVK